MAQRVELSGNSSDHGVAQVACNLGLAGGIVIVLLREPHSIHVIQALPASGTPSPILTFAIRPSADPGRAIAADDTPRM
ncbi:MAG: hypothetical protein H6823_09685 [Planctomycetaceae bacterium]|nr:hypothetical protein [Planctomycetales bacterium]MCB9938501.1 hypothetical protein [Planctomycetaceae bacterium]